MRSDQAAEKPSRASPSQRREDGIVVPFRNGMNSGTTIDMPMAVRIVSYRCGRCIPVRRTSIRRAARKAEDAVDVQHCGASRASGRVAASS